MDVDSRPFSGCLKKARNGVAVAGPEYFRCSSGRRKVNTHCNHPPLLRDAPYVSTHKARKKGQIADPRHAVAACFHDKPANGIEKPGFACGTRERLVAGAMQQILRWVWNKQALFNVFLFLALMSLAYTLSTRDYRPTLHRTLINENSIRQAGSVLSLSCYEL